VRILCVVPARGGSKGVARTAGPLVRFLRPADLARDTTPTDQVVRHAIAASRATWPECDARRAEAPEVYRAVGGRS